MSFFWEEGVRERMRGGERREGGGEEGEREFGRDRRFREELY